MADYVEEGTCAKGNNVSKGIRCSYNVNLKDYGI